MSGPPQPKQGPKRKKPARADFSDAVKSEVSRRSGGLCEAKADGCQGRAVLYHHIRRRNQGDGSAGNAMHLCNWCHLHIHANVAESEKRGWLIRSRS